jgi:hypothetical protein
MLRKLIIEKIKEKRENIGIFRDSVKDANWWIKALMETTYKPSKKEKLEKRIQLYEI